MSDYLAYSILNKDTDTRKIIRTDIKPTTNHKYFKLVLDNNIEITGYNISFILKPEVLQQLEEL